MACCSGESREEKRSAGAEVSPSWFMEEKSCIISRRGRIWENCSPLLTGEIGRDLRKNLKKAGIRPGILSREFRGSAEESRQIPDFHAFDQEHERLLKPQGQVGNQGF